MHVFRVKHDDFNPASFRLHREYVGHRDPLLQHQSTMGYLSWLLKHMWKQNGRVRPDLADVEEDIKMVRNFMLSYYHVKVFCPEVEQQLLCWHYADRL